MARTFRRKRERHEYYWVLHNWESRAPFGHWVPLDPQSKAGRKAIARFHSDKSVTMGGSAPRWYRRCPITEFAPATTACCAAGWVIPNSILYFGPGTTTMRTGVGGDR